MELINQLRTKITDNGKEFFNFVCNFRQEYPIIMMQSGNISLNNSEIQTSNGMILFDGKKILL